MPSIGTFTYTAQRGRLVKASQQNAVIRPLPGVRGNGVVGGEYQADAQQIVTTIDVASITIYRQLRDQCLAMHRTVVSHVDPDGETWQNVTVVKVMPQPSVQLINAGKIRAICVWLLLPETTVPPGTT